MAGGKNSLRLDLGFAGVVCKVGSASTALQPFSLEYTHREEDWLLPADSMDGREGDRHILIPLAVTTSLPLAEICCCVELLAVRL